MTDIETAKARTSEVIDDLVRAWAEGEGSAFARPFTDEGWFVAFDGTLLRGRAEIGAFHQEAFTTHLSGTRLQVDVEEVRLLAARLIVVLTRGGIRRDGESQGELIGASVQTYVMRELDGRFLIESFQNTRDRPIKGPKAAQVWSDFDRAWNQLG